jgi:hypothetical protein
MENIFQSTKLSWKIIAFHYYELKKQEAAETVF